MTFDDFLNDYKMIEFNYLKTEINSQCEFLKIHLLAVYGSIPNNQSKMLNKEKDVTQILNFLEFQAPFHLKHTLMIYNTRKQKVISTLIIVYAL